MLQFYNRMFSRDDQADHRITRLGLVRRIREVLPYPASAPAKPWSEVLGGEGGSWAKQDLSKEDLALASDVLAKGLSKGYEGSKGSEVELPPGLPQSVLALLASRPASTEEDEKHIEPLQQQGDKADGRDKLDEFLAKVSNG